MEYVRTLIFVAALCVFPVYCADANCTVSDGAQSSTLALRRCLFSNYDKQAQPVKDRTSVTNVSFHFLPHYFQLYGYYHVMQVHGFVRMEWVDENLSWNKAEYENVESLTVPGQSLWVPDLQYDELSDIQDTRHLVGDSPCILSSTGHVLCSSWTMHSVTCTTDVTRWPFDKHTCKVFVQNWSKTQNLNITLKDGGISFNLYKPGPVWELLNTSVERDEYVNYHKVTVSQLVYTFILRRHTGEGVSGVVLPAIVLASLTCLTFLLRSRSTERIPIICANIACHCLYLLHMSYRVGPNSGLTPLIVLFYRDSLFMAASSLVITIFVRKMDATSSSPPECLAGVVNGVLATVPGHTLLRSSYEPGKKIDGAGDETNKEVVGPTIWRLLGALIDYLSLGVCVVATIVLLIKFLL